MGGTYIFAAFKSLDILDKNAQRSKMVKVLSRATRLLPSHVYAQKQAAGDYAVAEIVKDISPYACQHVHLIGAFDFEQTESQIDIDALAARYDDPDFWNRALVEAPDDSLTQPLDRTFTVLERWAFLSNQSVTAFRSGIGQKNLAGLSTNLRQIQGSTTTDAQYQRALAQFRRRPDPPGHVLDWVCRDNLSYLDLTQNRLEMDPD